MTFAISALHTFSPVSEESTLIRGLKDLYELLGNVTDLKQIDTCSFLQPFLLVIVSDSTDAFVTGIALQSLHKFLVYGLVNELSPRVSDALTNIIYYVTHCRFDGKFR